MRGRDEYKVMFILIRDNQCNQIRQKKEKVGLRTYPRTCLSSAGHDEKNFFFDLIDSVRQVHCR